MRENDQGDCFYILLEGEVEVSLLGKRLAVLKPGSCFGEILYFSDSVERRTTTARARPHRRGPDPGRRAARCHPRLPGRLQQGVHARAG